MDCAFRRHQLIFQRRRHRCGDRQVDAGSDTGIQGTHVRVKEGEASFTVGSERVSSVMSFNLHVKQRFTQKIDELTPRYVFREVKGVV